MLVYVVVDENREYQNAFFSRYSADLLIEKNPDWEIEPMDTVDAPLDAKVEKITPPNTDYAAALSMVKEFEKIKGVDCGTYHFAIWLHERLNA